MTNEAAPRFHRVLHAARPRWRELLRSYLTGKCLAHARRLDNLGQLDGGQPRQDVSPEQLGVMDDTRKGLLPLDERPLAGRDGRPRRPRCSGACRGSAAMQAVLAASEPSDASEEGVAQRSKSMR
jgi:hypothetical protein